MRTVSWIIPLTGLTNLTRSEKQAFGDAVIRRILERTARGIDVNGNLFTGYTKEYKESLDFRIAKSSSRVNLELSGDMLTSLSVIDIGTSSITIGFDDPDEEAKAAGNILGTYGQKTPNPSKARSFVGLPQAELDEIKATFRRITPRQQNVVRQRESILTSILSGVRARLFSSDNR